jgi:hypothetical protein
VQLLPTRSQSGQVLQPGARGAHGVIVVVGAHGGAGTTTLAILLQPAWDMGVVRPPGQGPPCFRPGGHLVLVTRNTTIAAGRAIGAINALSSQGARVAVLAVVSDGLPEPAPASYRFQLLRPRVGVLVRVPFVAALRAADDPVSVDLPRKADRVLAEIRGAALSLAGRGVTSAVEGGQRTWG